MITSRRMEQAGHVAHMEEMRNAYETLVVKPEGNCCLHFQGGSTVLQNNVILPLHYNVLQPTRPQYESSLQQKPQVSYLYYKWS
jgi:hypothetical protein